MLNGPEVATVTQLTYDDPHLLFNADVLTDAEMQEVARLQTMTRYFVGIVFG